jgi:hypothetical protein
MYSNIFQIYLFSHISSVLRRQKSNILSHTNFLSSLVSNQTNVNAILVSVSKSSSMYPQVKKALINKHINKRTIGHTYKLQIISRLHIVSHCSLSTVSSQITVSNITLKHTALPSISYQSLQIQPSTTAYPAPHFLSEN